MKNLLAYDEVFKLLNPKLFDSPYRGHIANFYSGLNKHGIIPKVDFLLSLPSLEVRGMTKEEELSYLNASGFYNQEPTPNNLSYKKTIGISQDLKGWELEDVLSHELYHSIGKIGEVQYVFYYDGLDEAITEYLRLKDKDKDKWYQFAHSYPLDVFVLQLLIYIYGDNWIKAYFHRSSVMYKFGMNPFTGKLVDTKKKFPKVIDEILKMSYSCFKLDDSKDLIYRYFYLSNLAPSIFRHDEAFFNQLDYTECSIDFIKKEIYNENSQNYLKMFFPGAIEANLSDVYDYLELNLPLEKKKILDKLDKIYFEKHAYLFRAILEKFLYIVDSKGISREDFIDYIYEMVKYKNEDFKEKYSKVIDDVFHRNVKRK